MFAQLKVFFLDEFCVLHMPRHIIIQNTRLGAMFRMMQAACIVALVVYCWRMDAYYETALATPKGLMLWPERPSKFRAGNNDVQHCMRPQSYAYNWTASSEYRFLPTSCREFSDGEILLSSRSDSEIGFVMHVQDAVTWRGAGSQCDEAARKWCRDITGASWTAADNDGCTCSKREEYFTKNPEEQRISFVHGFEVDFGIGDESHKVGQGSANRVPFFTGSSTTNAEMLTVILHKDGQSLCKVGGSAEWRKSDSQGGITGSLSEWLNCAGVSMDVDPYSLLPEPGIGFPPNLRTMGFTMELHLEYSNSAAEYPRYPVVCLVSVHVVPTWQTRTSTDYVMFGAFQDERQALLTRRSHGVVVTLKVGGEFRKFDFAKFLNFVVSSLVLFQVPWHICEFVALYMLGFISEIHRSAKRSKLNISNDFYSAIARMLVAEMGFRGLMGGQWTGSLKHLPGLGPHDLLRHIYDVFKDEIKNGVLDQSELRRMAVATFQHLDTHQKGLISCNDFIRECTTNESISVKNAAKFFDEDQGYGFLQRLLDNSHVKRKVIFKRADSHGDLGTLMDEDDQTHEQDGPAGGSAPNDREESAKRDTEREVPRGSNASSSRGPPVASTVSNASSLGGQHVLANLGSTDSLIEAHATVERRVALLEERDQRVLTGAEVMHLENRVAVLEAIENRRRTDALEANRESPTASVTPSPKVRETFAEKAEDPQVSDLIIKVQHLDDAIAYFRKKLEKQAAKLEAMVMQQEMQVCKALDERCSNIEERLHESLIAQSQRVLDSVKVKRPAHLSGQSDASSTAESTNFQWWSKAPSTRTGYDKDMDARAAVESIEIETITPAFGSVLPSCASSDHPGEPSPTRENSTSLYAGEVDDPQSHGRRQVVHGRPVSPGHYERGSASVAVWHPFDSQPTRSAAGLHPPNCEENRQSRHLPGQHRAQSRTKSRGHSIHSPDFDNVSALQSAWWRQKDTRI